MSLLLGDEAVRDDPRFHDLENKHRQAMAAYRDQDWALALSLIEEIRKSPLAPQAVYDLYEERIAEQQRREAEVFREHTVDPLTGAHNRFYYSKLARGEAQRARRTGWAVTEVIFEIADFDVLNQACGRVGV